MHHILSRGKEELIRKIYEAQKRKPVKNDWINIIKRDCEELKITYNESQISSLKNTKFKDIVREKIRTNAFKFLMEIKISQSKLNDIDYTKFEIQKYLRSNNLTNESLESEQGQCKTLKQISEQNLVTTSDVECVSHHTWRNPNAIF